MHNNKKSPHMVTFLLLIIGGLNWLVFGIFQIEIGYLFGGADALISRAIYILVGLAAIYEIATHKQNCRACGSSKSGEHKANEASNTPQEPPQAPQV